MSQFEYWRLGDVLVGSIITVSIWWFCLVVSSAARMDLILAAWFKYRCV